MRDADFGPTPGKCRRASISASSAGTWPGAASCMTCRGQVRGHFSSTSPVAQNGSFMPGGRGMPAVAAPIFSCDVASALRTASLKAAATRSSSMSRSSATRLGSMFTRLTPYLQVIVTFTKPAPDWPSTSIWPSSSWTRLRLSCICCACFIRPESCPLLNMGCPSIEK